MHYLIFTALFLTALPLAAAVRQELPKNEPPPLKDPKEIIQLQLNSLDHLTDVTEKTLTKLKELKTLIARYKTIQELYLQQTQNKELLFRMTKLANGLLSEIKSAHLTHLFDEEFINELTLLSKIYKKNEIPQL